MKKENNCYLQKRKARGEGDNCQYAENKIRVSIWGWSLTWLIAGLSLVIFEDPVRERSQHVDRSPAEDNKLYTTYYFSLEEEKQGPPGELTNFPTGLELYSIQELISQDYFSPSHSPLT
jgi:hypothetical protein